MRVIAVHQTGMVAPHEIWHAWSWEPAVVLGLAAAALIYSLGIARLWKEAGRGRSVGLWRAGCLAAGLLTLGLALLSPLDSLAETLFSAHMVQHLLLMLVAPPLLVLGAPSRVALWSFPFHTRRSAGLWWHQRREFRRILARFSSPAVAWVLAVVILLLWHVPGWYQAALSSESLHAAEHLSFLLTGYLFWWVLLRPDGRRRLNRPASVLYLFAAALPSGLLGALLTFAGRPLYPAQSLGAPLWGLTPLEDQQLAGLIMWMPGGLIYLCTAAGFFLAWLRQDDLGTYRPDVVTELNAPAGMALVADTLWNIPPQQREI